MQSLERSLIVTSLCIFPLRLHCSFCYVASLVCLTPCHLHQCVDSKVTCRARYTLLLNFDLLAAGRLSDCLAAPDTTLPSATGNTRYEFGTKHTQRYFKRKYSLNRASGSFTVSCTGNKSNEYRRGFVTFRGVQGSILGSDASCNDLRTFSISPEPL
jgi:hypothetical protein